MAVYYPTHPEDRLATQKELEERQKDREERERKEKRNNRRYWITTVIAAAALLLSLLSLLWQAYTWHYDHANTGVSTYQDDTICN